MPEESAQKRILENLSQDRGLARSILTRPIPSLGGLSINEILAITGESGRLDTQVTLALTTAQAKPMEIFGKGTKIIASDATDEDVEVTLRFDKPNNEPHKIKGEQDIVTPFERVFVEWSAQAGKSIKLQRVLVSELFQRNDRRKLTSIDSITSIDSLPGLTEPPAGATEVVGRIVSGSGSGSGLTSIYTVTTGKVLVITEASISAKGSSFTDIVELVITDGSNVFVSTLRGLLALDSASNVFLSLPAVRVPAGYKIQLRKRLNDDTNSGDAYAFGFFRGWEETA